MLIHGLAGFLLLMTVNILAGPTGFWSADEAVAHLQIDLLAEGRWTDPLPEPALDPDGRWHTSSPLSVGEGVVGPYVKHPIFPALVRIADAAGGPTGRFVVSALSAVVAALLIAMGGEHRRCGSARMTFWLALAGTPLLFHGAMLWAHAPAIAATAAIFLIVQSRMDPSSNRFNQLAFGAIWPVFTVLIGFAVLVRSEAAIFYVLFGLCLAAMATIDIVGHRTASRPQTEAGRAPDTRSGPELLVLGVTSVAITLAAYRLDGVLRSAILGDTGDVSLGVPPEPLFDLNVRGGLIWRWLVGTRPGIGLGLGRIIGTILLAAAAASVRPSSKLTLSPIVGLIGGLLFLPALFSESAVAVGPAAPAIVVGLLILSSADRLVRFIGVLSALYFAAVVATSYANGGGGDWGGRYLALLLAPLAIVGLPELWRISRVADLRPLAAGVVVASAALAFSMSADVIDARRNTTNLAATLSDDLDTLTTPGDIVVTTDSRIGRLLGASRVDHRLLQVPTDSMQQLADRLPAEGELLIVDLLDPFTVPDTWSVVERSAYAIRVRPGG